MSDTHLTDVSFTNLHLPEALARGIADAGFERCTPIQAQTLPRALAGYGRGRPGADGHRQDRGIPRRAVRRRCCVARCRRRAPVSAPRALILAPTRELAVQIHSDAEILGQYTGLTLGLAFGGVDYEKQRRDARGRRRRPDRHAGAAHRFLQAARLRPAPRAGAGARRSGPHVRSGLHRRHPLHPAAAAAARGATQHAVLGDAVPARAGARLRAHERSGARADRAGQDDGRPRPPVDLFPVDGREAAAARRACCGRWTRTARWSSSTRGAAPRSSKPCCKCERHQCRGDLGRRAAAASACACCATSTAATSRF